MLRQFGDFSCIFAPQSDMQGLNQAILQGQTLEQGGNDAGMTHVQNHTRQASSLGPSQGQGQNFQIGFGTGVAINFSAQLVGLTGGTGPICAGVQDGTAITQPGDPFSVEQMSIYARNLHRGVSTQPQSAARQLVDQLEGL